MMIWYIHSAQRGVVMGSIFNRDETRILSWSGQTVRWFDSSWRGSNLLRLLAIILRPITIYRRYQHAMASILQVIPVQ